MEILAYLDKALVHQMRQRYVLPATEEAGFPLHNQLLNLTQEPLYTHARTQDVERETIVANLGRMLRHLDGGM